MEGIVDREEVFEQNIKDTEIYLNDATDLETVTDGSEKEGDIELNDKKIMLYLLRVKICKTA